MGDLYIKAKKKSCEEDVIVIGYNALKTSKSLVLRQSGRVSCVILDGLSNPVVSLNGVVVSAPFDIVPTDVLSIDFDLTLKEGVVVLEGSFTYPFIFTVDSGADARYTIPTTGGGYNYSVYTSDGQTFNGVTGNQLILFPSTNTLYDIEIRGLFPQIRINNNAERLKVRNIKQWGDIVMGVNQTQSYYNASSMTCTATDSPDMLLVTNGGGMFQQAASFNPPNFNPTLANLTNGAGMFAQATSFNPSNFAPTLANLTNGSYMFTMATSFEQEIYAPNSIHLTDDRSMFRQTEIAKITMNNTALTTTDAAAFQCPLLTDLILIDRKVDLTISYSPLLLGLKIDALANSVADLTGLTTKSVTMTLAQRASCNQALWTNKNWTIIAV